MAISHGCGGRVEEDQGGAEGVRGCGRVGVVPPGLRTWGWNDVGTTMGKSSGESSGRMTCGGRGLRGHSSSAHENRRFSASPFAALGAGYRVP
jgi:hypothetical protein